MPCGLDPVLGEALPFFVESAQMLGLPKSLGEIYAIVFFSTRPLCMEDIVRKLQISLGTASQGLRQLRQLKAVRVVSLAGERRDYYVAETELRQLLGNFLAEVVSPQISTGAQRLERIQNKLPEVAPASRKLYKQRLAKLEQWNRAGASLIPRIARWIRI